MLTEAPRFVSACSMKELASTRGHYGGQDTQSNTSDMEPHAATAKQGEITVEYPNPMTGRLACDLLPMMKSIIDYETSFSPRPVCSDTYVYPRKQLCKSRRPVEHSEKIYA